MRLVSHHLITSYRYFVLFLPSIKPSVDIFTHNHYAYSDMTSFTNEMKTNSNKMFMKKTTLDCLLPDAHIFIRIVCIKTISTL